MRLKERTRCRRRTQQIWHLCDRFSAEFLAWWPGTLLWIRDLYVDVSKWLRRLWGSAMALRGQERGQRMTAELTMEGFHSDISSDCHIRTRTERNGSGTFQNSRVLCRVLAPLCIWRPPQDSRPLWAPWFPDGRKWEVNSDRGEQRWCKNRFLHAKG